MPSARLTRALHPRRVPYRNADVETWPGFLRELGAAVAIAAAGYAAIVLVFGWPA